jgi:hypothetical protein
MDTVGYVYDNSFDLLSPSTNLVAWNDDGMENSQFQILLNFQSTRKYIFVLTTRQEFVAGRFLIIARGPGKIGFSPLILPGMS